MLMLKMAAVKPKSLSQVASAGRRRRRQRPQGKGPQLVLFRTFPVTLSLRSLLETADRGFNCVCLKIINNLNLSNLLRPRCKTTVLIFGNSGKMISTRKSLLYYLKAGQLEIAC